jgi:transposase-like protein
MSALARMEETPSLVGLAEELGVERRLLYCWRDKYAAGGEPAEQTVANAQQRIAELERKACPRA